MTIPALDLRSLKQAKNTVIGNPQAKAALAQDEQFIRRLVGLLDPPATHPETSTVPVDEIRREVVDIIASFCHGSDEALYHIISADAHETLLLSISHFAAADKHALHVAFFRCLKILASAAADAIGPPLWELQRENIRLQLAAKPVLNCLFSLDALGIYLPYLENKHPPSVTAILSMLASCVRTPAQRELLKSWKSPTDRVKDVKGKRGWERPAVHDVHHGGWITATLLVLIKDENPKVKEAALHALAALARDNASLALILAKAPPDRTAQSTVQTILLLTKSRSSDIQLAACLCATRIIRANPLQAPSGLGMTAENASALAVMHVLDRIIASPLETPRHRARACFILQALIKDDIRLCQAAYDQHSLAQLIDVVRSITPLDENDRPMDWDEQEPENTAILREAALMSIAMICMFDDHIRRAATDSLGLVPVLQLAIVHRRPGVRFAACTCLRALSRTAAIVMTSVVDSGLGAAAIAIVCKKADRDGGAGEDRRVVCAALAAVCNLVVDYPPLRKKVMEQATLDRLVELMKSDDHPLALNALWAFKNLLFKATTEVKQQAMERLGWLTLEHLLTHTGSDIQEQAFNILKNIADKEQYIKVVFEAMGTDKLLGALAAGLKSDNENVQREAIFVLSHFANGYASERDKLFDDARVLAALRSCIADPKVDVRQPAIACVARLVSKAQADGRKLRLLREAGMDGALRALCESTVGPGGPAVEMDRERRDEAQTALATLVHSLDEEMEGILGDGDG